MSGNCSICLESFKDPIATPCGHVHCEKCLTDYVNSTTDAMNASCPDCRAEFPIVTPDLRFLPAKYHPFVTPSFRKLYIDMSSSASLRRRIVRLEATVANLNAKNEQLMDKCERHWSAIEVHRSGETDAWREVARLEEELEEMTDARDVAESAVDELRSEIADARDEAEAARDEAEHAQQVADDALDAARNTRNAVDDLTGANADLRIQNRALKQQVSDFLSETSDLTEQVGETEEQLHAANQELTAARARVNQVNAEHTETRRKYDKMKRRYAELSKETAENSTPEPSRRQNKVPLKRKSSQELDRSSAADGEVFVRKTRPLPVRRAAAPPAEHVGVKRRRIINADRQTIYVDDD